MAEGLARVASRLVTPSAAMSDSGVPSRAVTCRSIRYAWLTCGNGRSPGASQDLDGAGFDPAVAAVGDGVGDRDVAPGQGVQGIEQAGLVVLAGKMKSAPRPCR